MNLTIPSPGLLRRIPYKWRVFITVAVGGLMTTLDSSIVNIALPQMGDYFKAQVTAVEWVSIAYVVAVTGLLPTVGRLSDMRGRKRLYTGGFAVFTLASALCAFSPTLNFLIAARAFQAVGGAMMYANSMAIVTEAFPPEERGRAMGLMGSIVAIGLTLGPTLGGFLVGWLNWHAIFTINLPIGAVGIVLAARVLKDDACHDTSQRFDLVGAALLLVALVGLTLGLSEGTNWGWRSVPTLGLLAFSVVSGVAFVLVEKRVEQPAVDLKLFRNRLFAASNLSLLLCFCASFTSVLMMPFYLQDLLGWSPQRAGGLLTIVPLIQFVVSPLSGWLSDRIGSIILASSGLAIGGLSFALISQLGTQATPFDILWRMALMGIGFGLFQAPNNSALMGAAPRRRYGVAAGIMALMRNLGMAIGLALSGAMFASRQATYLVDGLSAQDAFAGGFHDVYLLATGLCFVGVLASLVRGNGESNRSGASEVEETC